MRTATSMRWLMVLATAVACVRAEEGNAGVTLGTDTIEVNELAVDSPISFALDPTPAPSTTTKKPSSTPTSTDATTAPAVPDGSSNTDANTVGSVVTCAFRYSLPTASNLADELARFAAAKTPVPTATPSTSSAAGSTSGSGPTESSGSADPATEAPDDTTSPPSRTRTPTTAPPAGSGDGLRRRLQVEAGDNVPAATTPAPTKKPTTAPVTRKPTTAPPSTPAPSDGSSDAAAPTPTPSDPVSSTESSGSADDVGTPSPSIVTGEFTCDASFYGAWSTLGLTCGDEPLDVDAAVAQSQCLIYGGVQTVVVDINMCMSVCKFPKCANGTWDYSAEDGFTSEIYDKLDFGAFMSSVGKSDLLDSGVSSVLKSLDFQTDRQCAYASEASFASCQCENLIIPGSKSNSSTPSPALQPAKDKGLGDADHWPDGLAKTGIDKAGIGIGAIGTSAAVVSVTAGAVMSVAGSVMGTSAGVAGGVSAGASLGLAMAAVDLCQFAVMINQLDLDAKPRLLQEMGKRMAPATFSFLPFGKVENVTTVDKRRLETSDNNVTSGMDRYAELIGVQVDKLFYLTLAGVMLLCVAPFVLCLLLVVVAAPCVGNFRTFARKWFDKSIGALMMILILSEYVVGVTATFQICYSIRENTLDAGFYLAIFALLFFAIGTILFGIYIVRQYEDDLRDLGTKHHFDKKVHARYGPLYDEYSFEGRYFFAPKLIMALLCGVTTGLIFIKGLYQVIILLAIHVGFLMYLEVKRPFPQAFVQKTSSFVVIIKISALFLTLFLLTSVAMAEDIPVDLRRGVGFAIIGLQVLVLVCLMIRQMYIFYITWKLKREDDEKKEHEGNTRSFQPLGSSIDGMYPGDRNQGTHQQGTHHQYNDNVAMLDGGRDSTPVQYAGDATPKLQFHGQYGHNEPVQPQFQQPKLRGLQGNHGMQRTQTVVRHDDPTPSHNYRRHHEIDL